jgi:hypothetical protein
LDEREDTIIRNDRLSLFTGQRETAESAACLIPRCGGVSGGFSTYPAVQLRKCRPTPSFTPRQTLMPEFDQAPFHIDKSRRHRGPVPYIAGLWCWRLRGACLRTACQSSRTLTPKGRRRHTFKAVECVGCELETWSQATCLPTVSVTSR